MNRPHVIAAAVALGLLLAPLAVTSPVAVINEPGVDSYESHKPFFGEHSVSQTLNLPVSRLSSLGVILVPYDSQPIAGDIVLTITDATTGEQVVRSTKPAAEVQDDAYLTFPLQKPGRLKNKPLRVSVTAPDAVRDARVAARFNPDTAAIAAGDLFYNQQQLNGDLALQAIGPANLYESLWFHLRTQRRHASQAAGALAAAAVVAAGYVWVQQKASLQIGTLKVSRVMVLVIIAAALMLPWRLWQLPNISGYSGGDPFNFFLITQRIQDSAQFFHPEQKRLPLYSLLLVPANWITSDILASARVLNQLYAAAALVAIAALGRQLKMSAGAVWLAVVFLAANNDFLFIPYRPLAYPLAGLLIVAALATLLWAKSNPQRLVLAGAVLGLAAQTRHEGLVAAAFVAAVAAAVWLFQKKWQAIAALLIPLTVIILPYVVTNTIFHGNPIYTGYIDHPVTTVYKSTGELTENLHEAWVILSSTWWPAGENSRSIPARTAAAIITGIAALTLLRITTRSGTHLPVAPTVAASLLVLLVALDTAISSPGRAVTAGSTFISLAAIAGLVTIVGTAARRRPNSRTRHLLWRASLVIIAAAAIVALVTWTDPAVKKYIAAIPFLSLFAGAAVASLLQLVQPRRAAPARPVTLWLITTALLFPLLIPFTTAYRTLPTMLEKFSREHRFEQLFYDAHRGLLNTDGSVGMRHRRLSAEYFLGSRAVEFPEHTEDPSIADLEARNITWLVTSSNDGLFSSYQDPAGGYEVSQTYSGEDDHDEIQRVTVLKIKR